MYKTNIIVCVPVRHVIISPNIDSFFIILNASELEKKSEKPHFHQNYGTSVVIPQAQLENNELEEY